MADYGYSSHGYPTMHERLSRRFTRRGEDFHTADLPKTAYSLSNTSRPVKRLQTRSSRPRSIMSEPLSAKEADIWSLAYAAGKAQQREDDVPIISHLRRELVSSPGQYHPAPEYFTHYPAAPPAPTFRYRVHRDDFEEVYSSDSADASEPEVRRTVVHRQPQRYRRTDDYAAPMDHDALLRREREREWEARAYIKRQNGMSSEEAKQRKAEDDAGLRREARRWRDDILDAEIETRSRAWEELRRDEERRERRRQDAPLRYL